MIHTFLKPKAALITFKIWNITRIARPIGGSNLTVRTSLIEFDPAIIIYYQHFLVIVVESAAIYA